MQEHINEIRMVYKLLYFYSYRKFDNLCIAMMVSIGAMGCVEDLQLTVVCHRPDEIQRKSCTAFIKPSVDCTTYMIGLPFISKY